jgi:hypothetical protein
MQQPASEAVVESYTTGITHNNLSCCVVPCGAQGSLSGILLGTSYYTRCCWHGLVNNKMSGGGCAAH